MAENQEWVELTVTVPVAAQDLVVDWLLEAGASGVQESYPGLFPADGEGEVISGDPSEWWGEAPKNKSGKVDLTAWLPKSYLNLENDFQGFLQRLEARFPGILVHKVSIEDVPAQDWNANWKATWKPTAIGMRLMVCPSWEEPPETDRIVMRIDPGMAFGTGTHFTTASCLSLIEEIVEKTTVDSLLDVGTGSGILAIGALLLGVKRAVGIEVDLDALAEARENAVRNGVADRMTVTSAGVGSGEGQFDVVVANLVAHTIVRLAKPICQAVADGGWLILSGILAEHEETVDREIQAHGLKRHASMTEDSWVTLLYRP